MGPIRTSATSCSLTRPPDGCVQLQVLHIADAVARRRDGRDMHVVRPAAGENVADFLAGDQGRCLPTDVPGVSPNSRAFARSGSTSMCGRSVCSEGMSVFNPRDVADALLDVLGLLLQRREVWTVDAHHDGLAGTGQHLLDALPEVGLHVAVEARVVLDRPCAPRPGSCRSRRSGLTLIQFSPKSTP